MRTIKQPLFLLILFLFSTIFSMVASATPNWSELERLINERKLTQVSLEVDKILKQAKREKDNKSWQQALVLGAAYKSQTGKYETALKYLNQAWPQDNESKMIINLHKAYLLINYIQAYRWEIQNREKISSKRALPLKKKTMAQLITEVNQAFSRAYILATKNDLPLDHFALPISSLKNYFVKSNYPANVRGNIRDTITYLWVTFLQDQSLWTPADTNKTNSFSLNQLLSVSYRDKFGLAPQTLPVKRQMWLLSDLEHYKASQNKPEAAMEAYRVKIETLSRLKNNPTETKQLITQLEQRIAHSNQNLPWINRLRNTLARLIRNTNTDDANIQSVRVLKQCLNQHKKHNVTAFCQRQLEEITRPLIRLNAMKTDGLKKRSLQVVHSNINKLYFRAWRIGVAELLQNKPFRYFKDINQKKIRKPMAQWQVNIVDKKDYKSHTTYIVPPLNQFGYWYITASNKPDFSNENTTLFSATTLNLTRLVADVQTGSKDAQSNNIISVTVHNGENGQLANNIKAELWTSNYNNPSKLVATGLTSTDGRASFKVKKEQQYKLILKQNNDFTVVDDVYPYFSDYSNFIHQNSLVFTDRAIYRPSQKILWKVVAYKGDPKTGKFRTFINTPGRVELYDANNKVVKNIAVRTNRYGSVSGEFTVPTGRLLGNWRIITSWGGTESIKVEEYKRPTFSVKLTGSKQALALDKPAKIDGLAKYYFGQSITDGKVKWRVKRNPISLWRYGGQGMIKGETIATGESRVDSSGHFSINFVPKSAKSSYFSSANRMGTGAENTQNFTVTADFTDSGGETRTATKTFNISKVGILASISSQQSFGIAGKAFKLSINRKDNDGTPRAGNAYWELYQVAQPGQAKMPSDLPRPKAEIKKSRFNIKGDLINPRWAATTSRLQELDALVKDWKDGRKIKRGTLFHDNSGNAEIALNGLGAGLYRLRYTTKNRWGIPYKTEKAFIISFQDKTTVRVPSVLELQNTRVEPGEKVTYLAGSGFKQSPVILEIYHGSKLLKRSVHRGGIKQFEFPVTQAHQGGLTFVSTLVKDYQLIRKTRRVFVPWADKKLNVSFSTFRDKLKPGQKETWRISVKDAKNKPMENSAVEVLASMYDRSLDLFATHSPQSVLGLYRQQSFRLNSRNSLGISRQTYSKDYIFKPLKIKYYSAAQLRLLASMGQAQYEMAMPSPAGMARPAPRMARRMVRRAPRRMAAPKAAVDVKALQTKLKSAGMYDGPVSGTVNSATRDALKRFMNGDTGDDNSSPLTSIKTRTNFNETAFFYPHLVLEKDGSVAFEFEVPESLTEWKVWVSAMTRDLRGGSATKLAKTSKELMIRPYLPRFLRAGDHAYIDVLINNASDKELSGKLDFDILDASTLNSIAPDFKLTNTVRNFKVSSGKSSKVRFSIVAPRTLGMVAIRARASANALGDGEQRPIPILPSRIHLSQSRFAALQGNMSRTLQFKELAQNNDPTRINDKLVVTVDGQLFYSTLNALPYLVKYPYECTEQTMNRFLSTAIVNSVFKNHPAIASMARKLSKRDTQFEKWNQINNDPNRKMLLEETPWLNDANGGQQKVDDLIRILNPSIANAQAQQALRKLRKAQAASGGFPWWEGGRESTYITTYLLQGFSRALEFKVNIPKDMVQKAWKYLDRRYKKYSNQQLTNNLYNITLTNYVLSSYPDNSWTGGAFSQQDRNKMLAVSFKNWRRLSGLLKAYLALTLKRAGRIQDAKLVFDSIMDSAKTDKDLGTYWAPEDRSWLWYNDRVDTHAFMLRAMMELNPNDERRHGLVQWLMLNKKLNHWKSTRATAESIYSLVHYLKKENQLGQEERALIKVGNLLDKTIVFKPNEYTGKAQLVVENKDIKPAMATITVKNQGKSLMFSSATWHFSTERLPKSAQGDFFQVTRRFFKRVQKNKQWTLLPLQEGAKINIGDQLEVQLSLRAKHSAEFVHLRAPRGAGFEPVEQTSGYRWDTGIGYYQTMRDSGTNYFFERLPAGEFSFKYRLRATTAGEYRVAPASVQSIYAPEFNAYSRGKRMHIQ